MKWIIFTVLLVTTLILTGVWIANAVSANMIDSWLSRAKDAGNPAQVSEFLSNYTQALYENDRVEGKYTSLFKYPGGKMTVYIRAIDGLKDRANALATQSPDETSYQMGLVNLEKDLGDIETAAYSVWFAGGGFWIMLLCIILGCTFYIPFFFNH